MTEDHDYEAHLARQLDVERNHVDELRRLADLMAPHARALWHWGDGHGGGIFKVIAEAAGFDYFAEIDRTGGSRSSPKAKIGARLAKRVFERDAYRCVHCGTHLDLSCDHIVAESRGGPTEYENLQTLCRSCNSRKGTR